ncbi:MAG: hypothetical protein V4671_02205 [Armatimonadota bacterium]
MSDLFSRYHRAFFVVNLFLLLLTGLVVYKIKTRIDLGSEVLVVPVQVDVPREGVPGLLTVGMPRHQVVSTLGPPRMTRRIGFGSQNLLELTPKVFAWVGFDEHEKLKTIQFHLSGSHQEYAGEQQISLLYKGRRYLLKSGMTREAIYQLFGRTQAIETWVVHENRKYIGLEDTGLRLDFERDRLTTATLVTYIQRFPKH